MPFLLDATLTTYHPVWRGTEGGPKDCKSRPLITLQQHLSDPATYPYVSVSGDCDAWPDGQRIALPEVSPDAVFRIVDTGSHFHGPISSSGCDYPVRCKVIRNEGREPFDICVDDGTGFGVMKSVVIVYPGDDFGGPLCPGAVQSGICSGTGEIDLSTVVAVPVGLAGRSVLAVGVAGLLLATGVVLSSGR